MLAAGRQGPRPARDSIVRAYSLLFARGITADVTAALHDPKIKPRLLDPDVNAGSWSLFVWRFVTGSPEEKKKSRRMSTKQVLTYASVDCARTTHGSIHQGIRHGKGADRYGPMAHTWPAMGHVRCCGVLRDYFRAGVFIAQFSGTRKGICNREPGDSALFNGTASLIRTTAVGCFLRATTGL